MKNLFRVRILVDGKTLSAAYFSDWDDAMDYMDPYIQPRNLGENGFQVCIDFVEVDVHVL